MAAATSLMLAAPSPKDVSQYLCISMLASIDPIRPSARVSGTDRNIPRKSSATSTALANQTSTMWMV